MDQFVSSEFRTWTFQIFQYGLQEKISSMASNYICIRILNSCNYSFSSITHSLVYDIFLSNLRQEGKLFKRDNKNLCWSNLTAHYRRPTYQTSFQIIFSIKFRPKYLNILAAWMLQASLSAMICFIARILGDLLSSPKKLWFQNIIVNKYFCLEARMSV